MVRPAQPVQRPQVKRDNDEDLSAEAAETLRVIQAEFARGQEEPTKAIPEDLAERYSYWYELDEQVKQGEELTGELLSWYESYPDSADFEAGRAVAELRRNSA